MKKYLQKIYLALILILLYAPIVTLMVLSFNNSKTRAKWGGVTLKWYQRLFQNEQIMSAFYTTLIIALLAVACIVTLSIFAVRSIMEGRSTFYTIGACGAMSMFVFQTMLNVFGSVDLFPFTGVTFPFVSNGGTSMMVSWALLAFLKSADTRERASIAVKAGERL